MTLTIPVHLTVLGIVLRLGSLWLLRNFLRLVFSSCRRALYFFSGLWLVLPVLKWLGAAFQPPAARTRHGVVILTRVPVQDRIKPRREAFAGLKNACFLERVLTENMAHMLTRMRSGSKGEMTTSQDAAPAIEEALELFLCYKLSYTCSYEIKDWLEQLPDYTHRFDHVKMTAEEASASLQPLEATFRDNLEHGNLDFEPDSYCRNKPERDPKDPPVFHYVSVQGRDFDRLLEVAFRAAFARGCREVVVLNPHAPAVSQEIVQEALDILRGKEGDDEVKPQVVIGRTNRGGVYLLGVCWSPDISLHLRRLTSDIIWGSLTAHAKLTANLSRLHWSAVSLRTVLDEVDGVQSLSLVPQHLGLPLEYLAHDDITVVIPTHNSDDHILNTLDALVQNASRKRNIQVIVVDGRSTDDTVEKVLEFQRTTLANSAQFESSSNGTQGGSGVASGTGMNHLHAHGNGTSRGSPRLHRRSSVDNILYPTSRAATRPRTSGCPIKLEVHTLPESIPAHRGNQISWAVSKHAKGSVLLLLHPGTHLPLYWDTTLLRCLSRLGVVLGTFSYHLFLRDKYIQRKNIPWALRCYLLDLVTNWRTVKLELPLGDQALFMYTYYYRLIGGYSDRQLLDDVELLERAQTAGHLGVSQAAVTVIPIRAIRYGFCRSSLLDALLLLAYKLGAKPETVPALHDNIDIVEPDYLDGY